MKLNHSKTPVILIVASSFLFLSSCKTPPKKKKQDIKIQIPTWNGEPAKVSLKDPRAIDQKITPLFYIASFFAWDELRYGLDWNKKNENRFKKQENASHYIDELGKNNAFDLLDNEDYAYLDKSVAQVLQKNETSSLLESQTLGGIAADIRINGELFNKDADEEYVKAKIDTLSKWLKYKENDTIKELFSKLVQSLGITKKMILVKEEKKDKESKWEVKNHDYFLDLDSNKESEISLRVNNYLKNNSLKIKNPYSEMIISTKGTNLKEMITCKINGDNISQGNELNYKLDAFVLEDVENSKYEFFIQYDGKWRSCKLNDVSNSGIQDFMPKIDGKNLLLFYNQY